MPVKFILTSKYLVGNMYFIGEPIDSVAQSSRAVIYSTFNPNPSKLTVVLQDIYSHSLLEPYTQYTQNTPKTGLASRLLGRILGSSVHWAAKSTTGHTCCCRRRCRLEVSGSVYI